MLRNLHLISSNWRRLNAAMALLYVLIGLVYVGNAWSPSSYGHLLRVAGASQTGIVLGEPRQIRSDEWAVTTPLTQATVNNGHQRFNHTSYYNEDLRINYAMPIFDWGMLFKPAHWASLLAPPAYAFSWYYFAMFGLFVFGYAHLFRVAGVSPTAAFLLSASLYFTGIVQFFWSSSASLLAIFPWLLVVLCSPMRLWLRLLLFYWIATCWLIGNFYPPLFISLSFVTLVLLIAYRPDLLRARLLLGIGLVTVAASGTAIFYLWDYLAQTITTIYPGQRTSAGGYYPKLLFLTQLWPAVLFDTNYRASVSFTNVVELGTVGLFWTLAALCFTDWSRWRELLLKRDRAFVVLTLGWVSTLLWMYAPIPSWVARILLWDRVPPERMAFASGLLLVFTVLRLTSVLGLRVGRLRLLVYVAVVLAGWLMFEAMTRAFAGPWQHPYQLLIIPAVGISLWIAARYRKSTACALLWSGLVTGMVLFGRFNPIQSAIPIFDRTPNAMTTVLSANVDDQGVLTVTHDGLTGATLNGLGFRAVEHLNAVPPLNVWRQKFGMLSDQEMLVLNRYAHVRLVASDSPRLLANDVVGVPIAAFRAQPVVTVVSGDPLLFGAKGGFVDDIRLDGALLTISGWAPWISQGAERQLLLVVSQAGAPALQFVSIFDQERWDVVAALNNPKLLLSGFVITVKLTGRLPATDQICLYARDGMLGPLYLLNNNKSDPLCSAQKHAAQAPGS